MPTFDPDNISPATETYLKREVASALMAGARDYIRERVDQESERGDVVTYTFPGESRQEVALIKGQLPAADEDTTVLIHNEEQHDQNFPGDRLMVISSWIINSSGIGFRQEVVYPYEEEEDVWNMPDHAPLILNHAIEDEDHESHGEIAAHLYMTDERVDPLYFVPTDDVEPTRTRLDFLLQACHVLRFSCTEATYNEHIQKLA